MNILLNNQYLLTPFLSGLFEAKTMARRQALPKVLHTRRLSRLYITYKIMRSGFQYLI